MRELEPLLNLEGKSKIRQDIKYLEYGIAGEKNIAFKLKKRYIVDTSFLEKKEIVKEIIQKDKFLL